MSAVTGKSPITHESFPLAPRHPIWRGIVNVFVGFHLFAILIWNMPTSFTQSQIHAKLFRYMSYMGIAQGWGMFAPDPGRDNAYMQARITYKDGRKRIWEIGRQDNTPVWPKLIKERERKMVETLYDPNTARSYYPQMALWAAKRNNIYRNNPPIKIEIMRVWTFIPPPPDGINKPVLNEWHNDVVFNTPVHVEARK